MITKRMSGVVVTGLVLASLFHRSGYAMDDGFEYVASKEYVDCWHGGQIRDCLLGYVSCAGACVCGALALKEAAPMGVAIPVIMCGVLACQWLCTERLCGPCTSFRQACQILDQLEQVDLSQKSADLLDYVYAPHLVESSRLLNYMAGLDGFDDEARAKIDRARHRCSALSQKIWHESNLRPHVMD